MRVNLTELNKSVEGVVNVAHIIPLSDLSEIKDKRKEELCNLLFEKLVIETNNNDQMQIVFDENIEDVSNEIRQLR